MISYFLFYWYTIPSMEISKPIYFQYSDNSLWAHADFSSEKRFINEQSYNILLELFVPLSKFNIDIGNFMANIKLYSKLGILSISSRPAILTFSSSLLTKIRTFVMSPIFILGLLKEEERLIIPLVEEFKYYKTHETTLKFANITLSRNVQIYSSRLIFETQLHGIKYMMYYHQIFSFIIFTILFWMINWVFIINLYFIGKRIFKSYQSSFLYNNVPIYKQNQFNCKKSVISLKKDESLKNKESNEENFPNFPSK